MCISPKDLGTTETMYVTCVRTVGTGRGAGESEAGGREQEEGKVEEGRREGEQVEKRTLRTTTAAMYVCAYPEKFDVTHDVEIRDVA